jgi:hypothetical protein
MHCSRPVSYLSMCDVNVSMSVTPCSSSLRMSIPAQSMNRLYATCAGTQHKFMMCEPSALICNLLCLAATSTAANPSPWITQL